MAYTYNFEFSVVDGDSTVNVEDIATNMPAPRSTFSPYIEAAPLASGGVRGLGWPVAVWEWDFLTQDQYDALRTLCSGASVACWIRTLTNDFETYKYYSAVLRWPEIGEGQRAGRRLQLRLEFVNLVEYTPTP